MTFSVSNILLLLFGRPPVVPHGVSIASPRSDAVLLEDESVEVRFRVMGRSAAQGASAIVEYEDADGLFHAIATVGIAGKGTYSTNWTAVLGAQRIRVSTLNDQDEVLGRDSVLITVRVPNEAPLLTYISQTAPPIKVGDDLIVLFSAEDDNPVVLENFSSELPVGAVASFEKVGEGDYACTVSGLSAGADQLIRIIYTDSEGLSDSIETLVTVEPLPSGNAPEAITDLVLEISPEAITDLVIEEYA